MTAPRWSTVMAGEYPSMIAAAGPLWSSICGLDPDLPDVQARFPLYLAEQQVQLD